MKAPRVRGAVTAKLLDSAYVAAVARAGESPNTLGFLRRVSGSQYHRVAPNGRDDSPSQRELDIALATLRFVARSGRW